MWRSLVARTLGVGEAAGSNPVIPIRKGSRLLQESRAFVLYTPAFVTISGARAQ